MNSKALQIRQSLEEHYSHLRGIVARIARDEGLIDDILQECCARIIQKEALWNGDVDGVKPWMNQITRNQTLRYLSNENRHSSHEFDEDGIVSLEEDPVDEDRVRWILNQYKTLPDRQQTILVMRYLEGFDNFEIANQLGLAPQTVSTHLHRAISTLRGRARSAGLLSWILPAALLTRTGELQASSAAGKIALAAGAATASVAVAGGIIYEDMNERLQDSERKVLTLETALETRAAYDLRLNAPSNRPTIKKPVPEVDRTTVPTKVVEAKKPIANGSGADVVRQPDLTPLQRGEARLDDVTRELLDSLMTEFKKVAKVPESTVGEVRSLYCRRLLEFMARFDPVISSDIEGLGKPMTQKEFEKKIEDLIKADKAALLRKLESQRIEKIRAGNVTRQVAFMAKRLPGLEDKQQAKLREGLLSLDKTLNPRVSLAESLGVEDEPVTQEQFVAFMKKKVELIHSVLTKEQFEVYKKEFGVR